MNVGLAFRERLGGVSQWLVEELDQLTACIAAGWNVEHTIDGRHGIVTSATQPRWSLTTTATQSIPDTTATALTWNMEGTDIGDLHSLGTNLDRVTIGVAGWYSVMAQVHFVANATGYRQAQLRQTGTQRAIKRDVTASAGADSVLQLVWQGPCIAGDVLSIEAIQTSGGALNASTEAFFSGVKLW